MYFRARTAEYGSKWYHTDYDAIGLMDYEYMAKINKFVFAIVRQFDRGSHPLRRRSARGPTSTTTSTAPPSWAAGA